MRSKVSSWKLLHSWDVVHGICALCLRRKESETLGVQKNVGSWSLKSKGRINMQDNNCGRIKFIISSQSCRRRFILCKGHPLQLWAPQPRALSPGALKASSGCLASGSICGKKTFRLVHHATFGHASQIYHLLSADQLLPEWKPYQKVLIIRGVSWSICGLLAVTQQVFWYLE